MKAATDILEKKLLYILHRSLVDARNLSMAGHLDQVVDLADHFEWLPSLIAGRSTADLGAFREGLESYQSKYGVRAFDYLSVLDLDDEAFRDAYRSW